MRNRKIVAIIVTLAMILSQAGIVSFADNIPTKRSPLVVTFYGEKNISVLLNQYDTLKIGKLGKNVFYSDGTIDLAQLAMNNLVSNTTESTNTDNTDYYCGAFESSNGSVISVSQTTKTDNSIASGEYRLIVYGTGNATITGHFHQNGGTYDFNIPAKVENVVTKAPQAVDGLTYNGSTQKLITAGEAAAGYKVKYHVSNQDNDSTLTWTEYNDIRISGSAMTYYVWYKAVPNNEQGSADMTNNYDYVDCIKVSIGKADPAYTKEPQGVNATYTGSNISLVKSDGVAATGGTIQYSLEGQSYSANIPTASAAGTYTISYYIEGDDNHNNSEVKTITSTITSSGGGSGGGSVTPSESALHKASRLIDALPKPEDVTPDDEKVITEARAAFDALSESDQAKLTQAQKSKLLDCEDQLSRAKNYDIDQKEVESVFNLIEALDSDPAKVDEERARAALEVYKSLSIVKKTMLGVDANSKMADYQFYFDNKDAGAKKAAFRSVKAKKGGKAAVRWKKSAGVSGYQLVYSTSPKFTAGASKKVSIKSAKKTGRTIKNLKNGKKYYVRVRTFTKVKHNSTGKTVTVYGKWSGRKSFKAVK